MAGIAVIGVVGLAGCGGGLRTEGAAREASETARAALDGVKGEVRQPWSAVRLSKRPWLKLEALAETGAGTLPEKYRTDDAVTLPLSDIDGDDGLAARIEAATKLGVRLVGPSSGSGSVRGFASALTDGWTPAAGIWTGSLPRLLDAWCAGGGYAWRFEDGGLVVVRRTTVTFGVNALAGSQDYTASTSTEASGSGDGSSGGARQSIETRATFDPWPEIAKQVEQLAGEGSGLAVSPGSASVTVTGTPATIGRVRAYLRHVNRTVLRPLTLSAHVYSVTIGKRANYEVGIAALVDRVFGEELRVDVGAGRIAIVRPRSDVPAGRDTLSATLGALNSVGTASRVLSADVPSLNGKPAQHYELVRTAYLAERSTTVSETGVETELTPGVVVWGFAFSYSARITAPDEVLVRLVVSLRDEPEFVRFGEPGNEIQLPEYGDRGIQATQRLRRGETLIVSGFRDRTASSDRGGTFADGVPLPEGHRKASDVRREQVLLLTVEIGQPLGISETSEVVLSAVAPGGPPARAGMADGGGPRTAGIVSSPSGAG